MRVFTLAAVLALPLAAAAQRVGAHSLAAGSSRVVVHPFLQPTNAASGRPFAPGTRLGATATTAAAAGQLAPNPARELGHKRAA